MLDELRQIAIFAKTVDHGSFRAAARALRLSPSVVSHHVGQLEQHLGTPLLYRSTRKLSLTPDGKRLLQAARAMLAAAESGLDEIATQALQPAGLLRLTVPAVLAQSPLTKTLAEFSIANPRIRLAIDYSDSRRDLIADGYDVAIRAGEMEDSSLKARKLYSMQRHLVAAPNYIESRASPATPDDLTQWDWIELAPVWRQKLVFSQPGTTRQLVKPESRVSVNNAYALCQLARGGAGLAIVPEFLTEQDIAAGDLQTVLPDWTIDAIDVFAVWPSNAPRDGLTRHLINFLKDANT
jgi:DNA-binding transcriptional LysR family regulator